MLGDDRLARIRVSFNTHLDLELFAEREFHGCAESRNAKQPNNKFDSFLLPFYLIVDRDNPFLEIARAVF